MSFSFMFDFLFGYLIVGACKIEYEINGIPIDLDFMLDDCGASDAFPGEIIDVFIR